MAAITRAAQDANLNDYQLRNAPAKSELEGLQLQSQIGGEKAMAGYREAVGRGDPNALDKLSGQPGLQKQMYEAFDGMSPKEFMEAKKRADRIANAARYVGAIDPKDLGQNERWEASAQVLLEEGVIDKSQYNLLIESGPNEFILQQAQMTKQWVDQYGGQKKDDKSPEMKGLEVKKIRAEIDKIDRTGDDSQASRAELRLLEAQIRKLDAQTESEKTGDKKTTAAEMAEKGRNMRAARKEIGEFAADVMKRAYTPELMAAAEAKIAKKREEVMDFYGLENEEVPPPAPTGAADPTVPVGAAPGEEASPQAAIPQGAIDMLMKHPALAAKFDEKYGVGAAESVMGGQ
ncbi:MAG: hypothetical protein K8F25_10865 [Fimbriimonadaceae bacterium]|nr:hypothetical protein [Alphaproteobacteria bacterium]